MELSEMRSAWQAYDTRLEKALKLNIHCLEMIQTQKIRSKLSPMLWMRVLEVAIHAIIIYWLAGFLYDHITQAPYAISALFLIAFYMVEFINCIKQIITIKKMDYSNDIVSIQSSLVILQTHVLDYAKLIFLIFPVHLAFPIVGIKAFTDIDFISKLNGSWWQAQVILSVISIPVCIWLYSVISYRNIHKAWVRRIIRLLAGSRVTKAMEYIKELDELKHGK